MVVSAGMVSAGLSTPKRNQGQEDSWVGGIPGEGDFVARRVYRANRRVRTTSRDDWDEFRRMGRAAMV